MKRTLLCTAIAIKKGEATTAPTIHVLICEVSKCKK